MPAPELSVINTNTLIGYKLLVKPRRLRRGRCTAAALQSYRSYNVSDMALLVQQMKQLH